MKLVSGGCTRKLQGSVVHEVSHKILLSVVSDGSKYHTRKPTRPSYADVSESVSWNILKEVKDVSLACLWVDLILSNINHGQVPTISHHLSFVACMAVAVIPLHNHISRSAYRASIINKAHAAMRHNNHGKLSARSQLIELVCVRIR